jgi:hypothetical protein
MPTRYKREEIVLCTSNMTSCKLEFEFLIVLQENVVYKHIEFARRDIQTCFVRASPATNVNGRETTVT